MQKFQEYLDLKEVSAVRIGTDLVGAKSLSNQESDMLIKLYQAIDIAWTNYRSETINFLNRLAGKNDVIKRIVDELRGTNMSILTRATRRTPDMEISPDENL